MKTKVVNIKKENCDVFIGRGSKWGNPFKIGKDGNRTEVIKKYKEYLIDNNELLEAVPKLKGKILGCYCKPKACHGDILADLAEDNGLLLLLKTKKLVEKMTIEEYDELCNKIEDSDDEF